MKLLGVAASCIATSVFAQAPSGSYEWQVSENGVNWTNVAFLTPNTTYHVRLLATWSGVTGTDIGFAGAQFDAIILGAGAGSTISNIQRPAPFAFAAQTLVASSYASGLKIDTSADTAAPGLGAGWVNPGQPAKDFAAAGTYNSNNPCVIFSYDIMPSDMVTISMVLNPTPGRAMSIYASAGGIQTRLNSTAITVSTASIIIPAPASIALVGLGGIAAGRRLDKRSKGLT